MSEIKPIEARHIYICMSQPSLKFALVIGNKRKRFAVVNHRLEVSLEVAATLDEVLASNETSLSRLLKKVDHEKAKQLIAKHQQQDRMSRVGGAVKGQMTTTHADTLGVLSKFEHVSNDPEQVAEFQKAMEDNHLLITEKVKSDVVADVVDTDTKPNSGLKLRRVDTNT